MIEATLHASIHMYVYIYVCMRKLIVNTSLIPYIFRHTYKNIYFLYFLFVIEMYKIQFSLYYEITYNV